MWCCWCTTLTPTFTMMSSPDVLSPRSCTCSTRLPWVVFKEAASHSWDRNLVWVGVHHGMYLCWSDHFDLHTTLCGYLAWCANPFYKLHVWWQ
jgi:hypothetical protein